MTEGTDIPLLREAGERLAATLDRLAADEEALRAPSRLPGWTRAHVLAHMALNAEGLARMVEGVHAGEPAPMYDADEARDRDIDELSSADGATLRDRGLAGSARLDRALTELSDQEWAATAERTPGGRAIAVRDVPGMRVTEIEVHHADLDYGYGPEDWPVEFAVIALDRARARIRTAFVASPDDVVRHWEYGECGDQPVQVTGPAWALAWWLTGRGEGEHLTSSTGVLPEIGAW